MSLQASGEISAEYQGRRLLAEHENDQCLGQKTHIRDVSKHSKGVASFAKFYSLEPAMEVERLTIELSLLRAERNSLDLEAKRKGEVACLADSRAKEAEERLKSESKRREYFERECTVLQKKIADVLKVYVENDSESESIAGSCALIELRAELNRKDIVIENLKNELSLLSERVEMFKRFEGENIVVQKNEIEHKQKLELINKELQKLLKIEHEAQGKLRAELSYSENARFLLEDKCALFSHRQTHLQSKNSNFFAGRQDFEQHHVIHTSMLSQQFDDPSFTQGANDKELLNSISNQAPELLFSFPVEVKTPQQSQNQQQLLLSSLKEQIDVLSEKKEEMNGQLEEILMQSMKGNSKKAKDLKHQFEKHFEEFFEELAKQTQHLLNLKMKVDEQDEMITACKNQSNNQIEELKRKHKTQIKLLLKNIDMLNRQKEDLLKQAEISISEVNKIQQKEQINSSKKENTKEKMKELNAVKPSTHCEKSQDNEIQDNSISKQFRLQKLKILETSTAPASKTTRDSSASYSERVNGDIPQNVTPFLEYPAKNQNYQIQKSTNFSVLQNKINQSFDQQQHCLSQGNKISHNNYLSMDVSDTNQGNNYGKSFNLNTLDINGQKSTEQPALALQQKETLKKNGRGSRSQSQLTSQDSYLQELKSQQGLTLNGECGNLMSQKSTRAPSNIAKPVFASTIFNPDKNGSIVSTNSQHREQVIPTFNGQKQPEQGHMAVKILNQQNSQRTNQINKQSIESNENNLKHSAETQNKSSILRINSQNGSCCSGESVKSIHLNENQRQEISSSIQNTRQNSISELNSCTNFTFTQSLNNNINNNKTQHQYLHQSQN